VFLLHEVHEVVGSREEDFEEVFRDGWLRALAQDDGARLLYFLHHAHGTGVSYNVVTLTALRDAAAWGRLARRCDAGDLSPLAAHLDELRHDVVAKLLVPLPWSPLREIDLASVPAAPVSREPALFMEDTVWPFEGKLEEYVRRSGEHYAAEMEKRAREGAAILAVQAGFRSAFGAGRRREIVLWQKVVQPKALLALLTSEVPARFKVPGTWMHDALSLRDRWQSKLLRSARWSPWG
jgi:hypothetical protein